MGRRAIYEFDMRVGHHRLLREADGDEQQQQQQQQQQVQALPQLQTNEVLQLQNQMAKELQKFDDDIKRIKDQQMQAENIVATDTKSFNEEGAANKAQLRMNIVANTKKVLELQNQLAIKTRDRANKQFEYETKIIQMQTKLNESMAMRLPEKYRGLNESSIHKAKIYMGDLVQNDDFHIIKGMTDFKHTFAESELLYGKDREGYYVVCIDQDDFQKMYDTLEETGYLKDDIIATVMPQVFDRNSMTK